jgi:predicted transcriptional regulator
MSRRTTTVRIPEDLAEEADIVARGRGVSVNALILDALQAEIDRVRSDTDFIETLRALTERDREILDRLAE